MISSWIRKKLDLIALGLMFLSPAMLFLAWVTLQWMEIYDDLPIQAHDWAIACTMALVGIGTALLIANGWAKKSET